MRCGLELEPLGDRAIAAVARGEIAGHAPDRGDAHAGLLVNVAIGQSALQELHHRPAIGHGLQLGGGAQIAEEAAAFLDAAQRENRRPERPLVLALLAYRHRSIGLHAFRQCINILIH